MADVTQAFDSAPAELPLRWALLGAARIADFAIAPALAALGSRAHVLGCRDASRGATFAQRHGIAVVTGYAEAVARDDVDAVYIALPNGLHEHWTLAALEAGKHVLCEKPLALSAASARRIGAAAMAHGGVVMEALMLAFHPKVQALQERIASADFGPVQLLAGSFTSPLEGSQDIRHSSTFGGGAMADLGIYPLWLMRHLTGSEPLLRHVSSRLGGDAASPVDTLTHAVLEFPATSGLPVIAHLDCGFGAAYGNRFTASSQWHRAELEPAFYSRDEVVRLEVDETRVEWPPFDPYRAMLAHFTRAARGLEPAKIGIEDSIRQAAALEAVLQAAGVAPARR